jgi:hypothetical protein
VDVVEAVDEELAVPETVPDAVIVAVPEAVFVLLVVESAVTEEEAVTVGVCVPVPDCVFVAVFVEVPVLVPVLVVVTAADGVCVKEDVTVCVAVTEGELDHV